MFEKILKFKSRWGLNHRSQMVLLSFAIAVIFNYFFAPDALNDAQRSIQFILIMSISLWLTEAVPAYSVGILIIFLCIILISPKTDISAAIFYQMWSSSIIFLMLGGFFLAEALSITGLDQKLFNYALSIYGTNPKKIILGLMLTTAILSMLMSNTATTAMMIASVTPFIRKFGEKEPFTKAVLIGIPTAAALGGLGTIIGTPPNAIAVAALAQENIPMNFVQWMVFGIPIALVTVILSWYLLIRVYPTKIKAINIEKTEIIETQQTEELKSKQKITVSTLAITLLLWLSTPLHGINTALIAAIPMVSFTFLGVLTAPDLKKLPWDTLFLVAGGLALGEAIKLTGLASFYIDKINLNDVNPVWIYIVFGYATVILSNIMSNTATTSLLIPVGIIILPNHILEISLVTGISASFALLLPVSTPPNAIAYSSGFLKQSDFRLCGIAIGLAGPLLTILCLYLAI